MADQQYYFEKVLGLFWTHIKMIPEEYLKLYNKFRETVQVVPRVEQSDDIDKKIQIDCDYFSMNFDKFSETCCRCTTIVKNEFDSILPNNVAQNQNFIEHNHSVEEYIEKDSIIRLIKHMDILTGMSLSINTHGNILVEKIRHLLEFITDLNKAIMEEKSFFEDINEQILLRHISQAMTEVIHGNNKKPTSTVSCKYTNTSYEVKVSQKGQSMVSLEITAPSPLNRLFDESLTIDDAERVLSMVDNMISKENKYNG